MNEGDLLEQSLGTEAPAGGDLVVEAMERGWLKPFRDGQWLYAGDWVALCRRLQAIYVERITRLGFEEWMFPRLIPAHALDDFRLSHYRPDSLFRVTTFDDPGEAQTVGVLDPVQCISLYESLRGKPIPAELLPLRIVECLGGWTWRNELDEELEGPVKCREFLRVESVYFGALDQVRALRRGVEDEIIGLLRDLGLSWRTVVGVPCMAIPEMIDGTRTARESDEVPVHDVEVLIGEDEWLEIAGCSVEGRFLIDSFSIARDDGGDIRSGCCGLGFNRLISCLFLQHGTRFEAWPATARELLRL